MNVIANTSGNQVALQLLHLLYGVISRVYRAITPDTKFIFCSLETTKYNKSIATVLRMHDFQGDKSRLLHGPGIGR